MKKTTTKESKKVYCPKCKTTNKNNIYFSSGDLGEQTYCRKCHTIS